ncbi:S41 family peptidase [Staphylococcus durrellii]|uniref:S41 family peptidase n=1 Tax=Staphylococcus durrellii TaxID=2781773 RepID=UPI00189F3AC1|nr:S41 family peptidase [Staphylococcus durrellii]MBF7017123.1 S41 family peptidase [Staphylococcus durrellii]
MPENNEEQQISNQQKRHVHFKLRTFIVMLIGIIVITAGVTVFATIAISHWASGLNSEQRASVKKIEQAYKTLDKEYYEPTDSKKLSDAAIKGMVSKLHDPYSDYMTKEQTKSFNEDVSGDFVGIGAEMQKKHNTIQITSPMKGSPAEKAGIKPKDIVTKVNGKSVEGKPLEDVVKQVRGKKGTRVTLTVERSSQHHDISIKRDTIHVKSVEYNKHGHIGVFTINKFQSGTSAELKSKIIKAHKQGVKNIVLDLRNNPGGLLNEAVKMANIFIDKNKAVVSLEKGKHKESIKAPNDALKEAKDMNVAILVNKGSASSSEVFTGAMKDYHKAKIYGTTTFGKGIVQTTKEFKDGSLLKYTELKWLTPHKHYIHGKGIKPNVEIKEPEYQSLTVIPDKTAYQLHDNNKNIKSIKIGLKALGYNVSNKSTNFDSELQQSIKSFQQKNNLSTTGKFDKETNDKFTLQLVQKANKEDTVLDKVLKQLN